MKTNDDTSFRKLLHDIRGGLSPILTYAQLIAYYADKTPPSADAIKESVKEIENRVKSVVSLLDQAGDSEHT